VCKQKERCEFLDDLKGCALKHVNEAKKLISLGRYEDAQVELGYAEKHLEENKCV
jgi:hypothetical protein